MHLDKSHLVVLRSNMFTLYCRGILMHWLLNCQLLISSFKSDQLSDVVWYNYIDSKSFAEYSRKALFRVRRDMISVIRPTSLAGRWPIGYSSAQDMTVSTRLITRDILIIMAEAWLNGRDVASVFWNARWWRSTSLNTLPTEPLVDLLEINSLFRTFSCEPYILGVYWYFTLRGTLMSNAIWNVTASLYCLRGDVSLKTEAWPTYKGLAY